MNNPFFLELKLAESLILSLRSVSHAISMEALHDALFALIESRSGDVKDVVGFVPTPNPLFGTYRIIDEAIIELMKSGILYNGRPWTGLIFIEIDLNSCKYLDRTWESKIEKINSLQDDFCNIYRDLMNSKWPEFSVAEN